MMVSWKAPLRSPGTRRTARTPNAQGFSRPQSNAVCAGQGGGECSNEASAGRKVRAREPRVSRIWALAGQTAGPVKQARIDRAAWHFGVSWGYFRRRQRYEVKHLSRQSNWSREPASALVEGVDCGWASQGTSSGALGGREGAQSAMRAGVGRERAAHAPSGVPTQ